MWSRSLPMRGNFWKELKSLTLTLSMVLPRPSPFGKKTKAKRSAAPAKAEESMKERLFELRKHGFNRLFQNGNIFEFSTPESLLEVDFSQPLFALVDRIAVAPDARARIVDAVETSYR